MKELWPGTRVRVFDPLLFKNDKDTPLSTTIKPATVVRWYGYINREMMRTFGWSYEAAQYPDCVDVVFDHRPDSISHGHFSEGVEIA